MGRKTFLEKTSARSAPDAVEHHRAKKSLGQNFLIDDNIARKIVESSCISKDDLVIEIGPGKGALTRLLLATGAKIVAVEKDRYLFGSLQEELSPYHNLSLVNGDFLQYEIPVHDSPVKIVGNIPYNLTSKIVSRIVDERDIIDSAVLMVQDEVAERLCAAAGGKEYGSISVRLQLVSEVKKLFLVSPSCFRPMPKIYSRVVRITFRETRRIEHEEEFVTFVKKAFGMRRKMFRHFAAHHYGKESIGLLKQKYRTNRVETFTPEEIYELFSILENNVRSN